MQFFDAVLLQLIVRQNHPTPLPIREPESENDTAPKVKLRQHRPCHGCSWYFPEIPYCDDPNRRDTQSMKN